MKGKCWWIIIIIFFFGGGEGAKGLLPPPPSKIIESGLRTPMLLQTWLTQLHVFISFADERFEIGTYDDYKQCFIF